MGRRKRCLVTRGLPRTQTQFPRDSSLEMRALPRWELTCKGNPHGGWGGADPGGTEVPCRRPVQQRRRGRSSQGSEQGRKTGAAGFIALRGLP